MRKLLKTLIIAEMVIVLMIGSSISCYAHPTAREHNKELEAVLFEDGYSRYKSDDINNDITALEYASYLTIDQFGGNGKSQFEKLKNLNIKGIPRKFASIDYTENLTGDGKVNANTHRMYTHQGWDRDYSSKGKNVEKFWKARRKVLLGTVNSIFNFSRITVMGFDDKCESLSGIIYYVHILGDYDEADNYKKISLLPDIAGRTNANDEDKDYDIITSLKNYVEVLFEDQKSSTDYKELVNGLDDIAEGSGVLVQSVGGVNTDEEFEEYHQYADDLMELLKDHIPKLLENEEFFKKVFYPNAA